MTSSVGSSDADAATLRSNFETLILTDETIEDFASSLEQVEVEYGVSGTSEVIALYYADGSLCGSLETNVQGLVSYN